MNNNLIKYGVENPNKFDKLRHSWIIGIINRNGVAVSKLFHFSEAETHEELFPLVHEKRWRWDFNQGITLSVYGDTFEEGDGDIVRNHLRREYGIKFQTNGYHDWQYLISKMSKNNY